MRYELTEADHPLGSPKWAEKFLQQDKYWCNADMEYIPIEEMERSHAQQTIIFLMRNAPQVALAVGLGKDDPDEYFEKLNNRAHIFDHELARQWLWGSPLISALLSRAAEIGEGNPPWAKKPTRRRTRVAAGVSVGYGSNEVDDADGMPY